MDRSSLVFAFVASLALHAVAGVLLQPGIARPASHRAPVPPLSARLQPVIPPQPAQEKSLSVQAGTPVAPDFAPISADLPPLPPEPQTPPQPDADPDADHALPFYYPPDKLTRQPEVLNAMDFDTALDSQPLPLPRVVATLYINIEGHVDRVTLAPELPDSPTRGRLIAYLLAQNILPGEIAHERVPATMQLEITREQTVAAPTPLVLPQKPAPQ